MEHWSLFCSCSPPVLCKDFQSSPLVECCSDALEGNPKWKSLIFLMAFVTFQVILSPASLLRVSSLTPVIVHCLVLTLLSTYLPSHAVKTNLMNSRKNNNFVNILIILSSFHIMIFSSPAPPPFPPPKAFCCGRGDHRKFSLLTVACFSPNLTELLKYFSSEQYSIKSLTLTPTRQKSHCT